MAKPDINERRFTAHLIVRLLMAALLLILGWMSAWPLVAPAAVPAGAAPDTFSAARAMEDLRIVAREPHAAGSEAQARVRDHILAQAAAAGLAAQVQKSGQIENVVVRLPGTASSRQVLITAHYDSHPPAPGAGDDGISVAAMLETMRVLAAGPALRNDVLFLFADGEELGYRGSLAFIREHPETKTDVGVVLCFDARPGNAPLVLRETASGDAWLMRQFAASRPLLYANSWASSSERGEIDTDCAQFIAAGYLGLEVENTASGTRYHTAADTADAVSPRLVQAYGATMERSARRFAGLDLAEARRTGDLTFFSAPLVGIVTYPVWLTPVVAIASTLAFVAVAVIAARRRRLSLGRGLLGLLGFAAALALVVVLATLLWRLLLDTYPVTEELTLHYFDFAGSGWWKIGITAAALLIIVAAISGLSRLLGAASMAAGGILAFLLVSWLAFFLMDSDSPLITPHLAWPLLGGVAGLAVLLVAHRGALPALGLLLAAIPVFVLIVPVVTLLVIPLEDGFSVPVLMMGLALGLLAPPIAFIAGRKA